MAKSRRHYTAGERAAAKALAKKLDLPCWAWIRRVQKSHWGRARVERGFFVGWNLPGLLCKDNVESKQV